MYKIDWDKVKMVEDLKAVLEALQITFGPEYPNLDKIQHLITPVSPFTKPHDNQQTLT